MPLDLSITASKTKINLGETVEVTYSCSGSFDCTLQADNMPVPITFGNGDVSGKIKLLPTASGTFNVILTALGNRAQRLGIDEFSITETESVTASVEVV